MKYFLLSFCICLGLSVFSQSKGLILLTGATFEELGLSFSDIRFEIDGQQWISNKLPLGKNVRITVFDPKGFFVQNGICRPAVSLLVKRQNGDTLGYTPNIFGNSRDSVDVSKLSKLVLNFGLKDRVAAGDPCRMEAVFYDRMGTNKLLLDMDFSLTEGDDLLQTSSAVYPYSASNGSCQVNSTLPLSEIIPKDTSINNELYQELILTGIPLTRKETEEFQQQLSFYKINFRQPTVLSIDPDKAVSFVLNRETGLYDIRVRIPKNQVSSPFYYWRLRLENENRKYVIDILNAF
ncbi:MAG: hypothetical protein ACO1O6_13190 [Bacteroidota bacterium]